MILFDINKLQEELKKLEEQTTLNEFWEDSQNSSKVLKQINTLKSKTINYNKIFTEISNALEMVNLLKEESDVSLEVELENQLKDLEKEVQKLEIETLLSGKYDINNAIVTIHPGAGGTESQDWAQMLYLCIPDGL